jgi:hypothetical protein
MAMMGEDTYPKLDEASRAAENKEAHHDKSHNNSVEAPCGIAFELAHGRLRKSSNGVV